MSSAGFKIQMDDLLSTAPTFDSNARELADALNAAADSLRALGSFWGSDKVGNQFASTYQKVVGEVLLMLGKTVEDLEGISQGLAGMAARYGQTESDLADVFRQSHLRADY